MAGIRRQLGSVTLCVLALFLAGCPPLPVTHYFNNTGDVITVHGESRTFEWQPKTTMRVEPSMHLDRSITGRELPERLRGPTTRPQDVYIMLEIERAGVRARYPLTLGAQRLPGGYEIGSGTREVFFQLEPDGRLYAVKPEQLGTQAPPGTPISPYWIEPLD